MEQGSLYAALPGARVDGHDFAEQAINSGATVVLAARPVGVPAIVVDDVLAAYGRLATAIAGRIPGLGVVAVTGSVGKTTTKDLLKGSNGVGLMALGSELAAGDATRSTEAPCEV